jgi:hypothetical protein
MAIATLILGAALVPMYQMFVRGKATATQSRIAYMAMHAGREELEEVRQLPFDRLAEAAHDWEPVRDNLFRRTLRWRGGPINVLAANPELRYPREYERIFTRLQVSDTDPPEPSRYRRVVVEIRWQEAGAGSEKRKEAISHFETIVASHNMAR